VLRFFIMPGHKVAKEAFKNQELYKKYCCLSCDGLLRDAVQSICGHWFCESCVSLLLNTRLVGMMVLS
jgi:hypothetical protein